MAARPRRPHQTPRPSARSTKRPKPAASQVRAVPKPSAETKKRSAGKSAKKQVPPSAVSTSFSDRLSERKKAARRKRRLWIGIVVALAIVVAGAVYALFFSPLLQLNPDKIAVKGTFSYVDRQRVDGRLKVLGNRSLLSITDSTVSRQLKDLTWIKTIEVNRIYPHAMTVSITERKPVARLVFRGRDYLVDAECVVLKTDRPAPAGLPIIRVYPRKQKDLEGYTAYALAIVKDMPENVKLKSISVDSKKLITLELASGATVRWGSPEDTEFKAKVMGTLIKAPASAYDVSDPVNPVTSQ